jgi:DeoR family suf operon transcriptional repressor
MTVPSSSLPPASEPLPRPLGLKGPRAEVVMELKRSGAVAAKGIAERLGLSLNAVRHHVKELEAAGLVDYERENRGVGAPAFVYRLTPAGEALFPRRYEDAVGRLLDYVVAREGRAAAVDVLESRYKELALRLRSALAEASPEERVTIVTRALAEEGYMPEIRSGQASGMQLVEHNCPIQQVAERFPEVCEAEARFLEEVLEAEVTRGDHIVSGCGTCEYHVAPVTLRGARRPVQQEDGQA